MQRGPRTDAIAALAPGLFVLLWSTGFIVARAAAPHADLNLFLLARFALAALVLAAIAAMAGAPWPTGRKAVFHIACGGLMHGVYLIGSYWAVGRGLSVGAMTLIGAMQPLFTALLAAVALAAPPSRTTWIGLLLGFLGVALVLWPSLRGGVGAITWPVLVVAFGSIGALTVGTLLQGRDVARADLRSASSLQNAGGALVALLALLMFGEARWDGAPVLWIALAWATLGLSVGAVSLLIWMVRRDRATKASALLLLAPPFAALEAYLLFGETLQPLQIAGFLLALVGVLLTRDRVDPRL